MTKDVRWDGEKNDWLKRHRHVAFEQAALKISEGDLLDIVDHPNAGR